MSLAAFLAYERRAPEAMLKLELFTHRNFAVGNVETLSMYAGLSILFFFFFFFFFPTIYLQQVARYSALRSGLTTLPVTLVMFALSKRVGALADKLGPRLFMGAGPLVAAGGIMLLVRVDRHVSDITDLLPGLLIFAIELSVTVSPLIATVLADEDESDAGIASAIDKQVARAAGLIGVSVMRVVVAGTLVGGTFAPNAASVHAFHMGMIVCAALVGAGAVAGAIGIVNPPRDVSAAQCLAASWSARRSRPCLTPHEADP